MKRVFSIFLSFILIFNLVVTSFSYADTISDLNDVEIGASIDNIEPLNEDDTTGNPGELIPQEIKQAGYEATGLLATILDWITSLITQVIMVPLGLILVTFPTIDSCIFNKGSFFKLSFFDANPNGLAGNLQASVSSIYNALRYLVTAIYIVILVYLAIRMMLSSVGRQKAHYKDLFKHWLVGLLLLFSFHWVMAFVIWLSNTLVGILADLSDQILTANTQFMSFVAFFTDGILGMAGISAFENLPFTSFIISRLATTSNLAYPLAQYLNIILPIITVLLFLLLLGSTFSIVFTYFRRLVTIAILILTFPLVALSYVFDKIGDRKAQTLSIWLKEFIVNVMVQPMHALILLFISVLFATGAPENIPETIVSTNLFGPHIVGAVMSIAALRLIPLGEDLLKKLFQINSSMGPGSQGIAGSMAKAGLALRGAKEMVGSIGKVGKNASALIRRHNAGTEIWQGKNKDNESYLKSVENLKGKNRFTKGYGMLKARNDFLKGNTDYEQLTKSILKETGARNLAEARAKTYAQLGSATLGAGTAITGADTGKFFSEASSRAALAAEAINGGFKTYHDIHNILKGDAEKAEDFIKRANELSNPNVNLDKLDKDDKKKIAAELGIHVDAVNNKSRDKIVAAYHEMEMPARYGIAKDEAKKFNSLYKGQKNVDKGLMPDGSAPLDINKIPNTNKYRTNRGIFATIDGGTYKINNDGNPKLADGEKQSFVLGKGQFVRNNIEALTNNIPEYIELSTNLARDESALKVAQKDEQSKALDFNKKQTTFKNAQKAYETGQRIVLDLQKKQVAYDQALEAYQLDNTVENGTDLKTKEAALHKAQETYNKNRLDIQTSNTEMETARTEMVAAESAYNEAQSTVRNLKRQISTTKSEIRKIENSEITKQITLDEAFIKAGAQPYYADTAIDAVYSGQTSGQIVHNNATQIELQANDSSYIITPEVFGPTPPQQVVLNAENIQKARKFAYLQAMIQNPTLGNRYENAIKDLEYALSSRDENNIQNASFNLSSVEAEVLEATNTKIAEFTSDLNNEVFENDANMDMRSFFQVNRATQEQTGKNFISTYTAPTEEAFSYGICDELTTTLDAWSNKLVAIAITRISDDKLSYHVCSKFNQDNPMAQGTISIEHPEKFTNETLSTNGNSITIVHTKDGWFTK